MSERAAPLRSTAAIALLQWSIVARASMNSKWRQSLGWIQLYLNFTPLAVAVHFLGRVADHILISQFGRNLFRDIAHLRQVVHTEHAPAGLLAQLIEKQRTGAFLGRSGIGVEQPD